MTISANAVYAVGFVDGEGNATLFGPFDSLEDAEDFTTPPGLDDLSRVRYTVNEPVEWTDTDGN